MISGCYNSQGTLTSTGGYLLVMSVLHDDWVCFLLTIREKVIHVLFRNLLMFIVWFVNIMFIYTNIKQQKKDKC